MNKEWILGICIALGLIIGGAMMPLAVRTWRAFDRTVDVKGLCEREVKADKVIWPLAYKVVGNDLNALLKEVDTNNEQILRFLHEGGLTDEEISISTPEINDRDASDYKNDRSYRYFVRNTITICTSQVDKVLALMDKQTELLKKGITFQSDYYSSNEARFYFESLNSIKPEMIEQATANARGAANKFAADSGSRLGKIKTASQGTFSISDRDSNTPYIKQVRVVTYVTYYLNN